MSGTSAGAKKAWKTIRAAARKRSNAAKRAWQTRRANTIWFGMKDSLVKKLRTAMHLPKSERHKVLTPQEKAWWASQNAKAAAGLL
jgi:hypothetical protein